jgi:hypothetical protein
MDTDTWGAATREQGSERAWDGVGLSLSRTSARENQLSDRRRRKLEPG